MAESGVFYTADDIATILTVSRPTAYRIIKRLNDELKDKGYIVVSGRVPKRYFNEKFYCWWKEKLHHDIKNPLTLMKIKVSGFLYVRHFFNTF